ncbi:MAG: endopeptidase La [Nitrospinae bacterium]|nr:endopeptidase La [Nitrospinota bacterium]
MAKKNEKDKDSSGKNKNNSDNIITTTNITESQVQLTIPSELPVIPVRDLVVFPYMIVPLFVGRDSSVEAVNSALAADRMMFLVTQRDPELEIPDESQLYSTGTVVMVIRMVKLDDGRIKILVQGLSRGTIEEFTQKEPFYKVKIHLIKDAEPVAGDNERPIGSEALLRNVKGQIKKILSLDKMLSPEISVVAEGISAPGKLADLIAANLGLKVDESQQVLELVDPEERLKKVSSLLDKEIELLSMQQKIHSATHEEIGKTQKEYYLREQLKAIQKELGESDNKGVEIEEFRANIKKAKMPSEVEAEALKQLDRFSKMHPESAEATTIRTYLEWMTELPWSKSTKDKLDIKNAAKILDEDHYGLEKIKARILEYLGVRKLKGKMKGPILCFVGPPGVGKTSLGKSIARSIGRKFLRISLGGMRDEAEIRGHRRTYIGAMPGRIIQGLKQVKANNPVFMMDEIDKIGTDFRGDPSSALLEVLDPEQNFSFSDHYIGAPFDLSNIMFIMTANTNETIPHALRDRMEIIYLSGYTVEEKMMIARRYLLGRQMEQNGISEKYITMSDGVLKRTILDYTREAGLRNMERQIASVCRKVAKKVAEGDKTLHHITTGNLHKYLGTPIFLPEGELGSHRIGVATGLAWTSFGGEIMYIEVQTMKGGGHLTLTGQLGDVMKESGRAAISYARSQAAKLGLKPDFYQKMDIHIHVPAGAIPKDGPSAGITMAAALISRLTGRELKKDVAMTGEITLTGRVLPIGGLKEKSLAARAAGIKTIIIPEANRKDLDDIPQNVRKEITFVPVSTMDEVVEKALRPEKKRRAKTTNKPKKK